MASLINLGAGPLSSRLFIGYRAPALVEQPEDNDEQRTKKRQTFLSELGRTFMPGTPLMQAPIGLSAYVPAVIDPPAGSGLPDEVAVIAYASRPVYDHFRANSLSRRMYTHSHVAVFDMARAVAEFPAAMPSPTTVEPNGRIHQFTCLMGDALIDWQSGSTRVLIVLPDSIGQPFRADMLGRLENAKAAAQAAGVDQVLMAVADNFAALWIHSRELVEDPIGKLAMLPNAARIFRDLIAIPAGVIGDSESGVSIAGSAAFTFRFERRMELFL